MDSLSERFLKDEAKVLSEPVSHLCNLSIASKQFAGTCKVAELKPLYKKGSFLSQSCKCRPISLLPLLFKVIEVVHDQTSTFLNSKNLLYTYQCGFRKKHLWIHGDGHDSNRSPEVL